MSEVAVNWIDPLKDGKSRIELLDSMGGDLDIANDARASFDKTSAELTSGDVRLIHYLIKHQHTSPLRGTVFKFKVKAPLFKFRQWWKHVIASSHNDEQLGWNEKSFRYVSVDDGNEFYMPSVFRQQSKDNRQATEGQLDEESNATAVMLYAQQCESSYQTYRTLLDMGVGRESARGILVPSVYTSWVWTTSLQSALHFISLRRGVGAQSEIGAYAQAIATLIEPKVPVAMDAWDAAHNE